MTFSITRSSFQLMRTSLFPTSNSQEWSKVMQFAQRWHSSQPTSAAPSQLPLPGEPGWTGFIKNAELAKLQAPLSPAEVQQGQAIYENNRKIEEINTKMNLILKSNKSLEGQIKRLIDKLQH